MSDHFATYFVNKPALANFSDYDSLVLKHLSIDALGERAHLTCIKLVPLLKTLNSRKLVALVKSLELIKFKDGAKIIRQGDKGDAFYIIETGSVQCRLMLYLKVASVLNYIKYFTSYK